MQAPPLYTAEQVRHLDQTAIESFGIDGFDLMKRAGRAAFRLARRYWPEVHSVVVLCGGGNNGGDGYIVAGLARQKGWQCRCIAVSEPDRLKGNARQAIEFARGEGVEVERYEALDGDEMEKALADTQLVVDTLLGTGLSGEVREPYATVIEAVNEAGAPVLAVDIPSGLCSNTGRSLGAAVEADVTITFIGRKAGLYTGKARDHTGPVTFDGLSVDAGVYAAEPEPVARLWRQQEVAGSLPHRRPTTHKGDCGRVLVVGGDEGMGGAGILTAESALRAGAGLVFLATREAHAPVAIARRPEIQARAVEHGNELDALLEKVDVVVLGPGLGRDAWGQQMFQRVWAFSGPVVADADALNLLSEAGDTRRPGWVLTPHPGEAARMLDSTVPRLEADRYQALRELVSHYQAAIVLKGAGSLVGAPGCTPALIEGGNPGMATAGMGDVLSGMIGALLGQGLDPFSAAATGAGWHALAGDAAACQVGITGLLAGDLCQYLLAAVSPEQAGISDAAD